MPDDPSRRRSLLTVALVGALLPDTVPEARMLRSWLDTWTGIGHIAVGMDRQGYEPPAHEVRRPRLASDVRHVGDGARPHCQHRLRVGADALAGGATGGPGGVTAG